MGSPTAWIQRQMAQVLTQERLAAMEAKGPVAGPDMADNLVAPLTALAAAVVAVAAGAAVVAVVATSYLSRSKHHW